MVTKKLLRVGIVLLGFSVSFASIAALGLPLIAVVAVSLVSTLVFTTWLGRRMGLSAPRALLIGTGFSICGASAIAGMEETAGADEEDVTVSIAMVTLFGTLALVLLPLLQGPLGLPTCSSACGRGPASTRSARWWPRPAPPARQWSRWRWSSSSPAS